MTLAQNLKAALATVRGAPSDAIKAIDAAEAAKAKAAATEAKRRADLSNKVAAGVADRAAALVADWRAIEAAAVQQAAERLALVQLQQEHGIRSPAEVAFSPVPVRLSGTIITAHLRRLLDSPIPWDKQGRSASALRSETAAAAAAERDRPAREARAATEAEIAERIAAKEREHAERRAARQAAAAEMGRRATGKATK